ncbi:MAG: hypothetical protein MJZ60_10550 [Bacteroidaceae bacterium]|nr:hypothetical protein [Bacteroidaceae bacterium]
MSQHFYADGATHNDHHKEINIGSVTSSDLKDIVKGFFEDDDVEDAEEVSDGDTLQPVKNLPKGNDDDNEMNDETNDTIMSESDELCHFIYPGLDEKEALQVHRQIKDLVKRFPMKDICSFLNRLAGEKKILQPQIPQNAFEELHRMGMPSPETRGFGYDNFCKYYRK